MGNRCNSDLYKNPALANSSECEDMNAGAFHVMITNLVGLQKSGFVIDRERSDQVCVLMVLQHQEWRYISVQVWNQPLFAYNASIDHVAGASSANVALTLYYAKETDADYNAHPTLVFNETYFYSLDIDSDGMVKGGKFKVLDLCFCSRLFLGTIWIEQEFDRTDFAWMVKLNPFSGYWKALGVIYAASVKRAPVLGVLAFALQNHDYFLCDCSFCF